MHPKEHVVLAVLSLCVGVTAQAVSTATVTQPLVVTSSTNGSQTFAPGPVPGTGISLQTPPSSVWARTNVTPFPSAYLPPGGAGWAVSTQVSVGIAYPGGAATSSLSGQVELHFSSPQPVSGLFYMYPTFTHSPLFQVFTGDLDLDVDCDGVADYPASVWNEQNVQIPLSLDATGTTLCLDLGMSGSWNYVGPGSVQGQAYAGWVVVFVPDAYALEQRNPGCAPIAFYRNRNARFSVVIASGPTGVSPSPIVSGMFLLGIGEQNVPLNMPPFCSLLVVNPIAVMPNFLWPTEMGLLPPDVAVPAGVHFYCQASWMNALGEVFTSDSIRTK